MKKCKSRSDNFQTIASGKGEKWQYEIRPGHFAFLTRLAFG
jgi:hypothetical protein